MKQEIVKAYLSRVDEVNRLARFTVDNNISQLESRPRRAAKNISDDIEDMLILGYLDGFYGANSMLNADVQVDIQKLINALAYKTKGKTYRDRIEEHVMNGRADLVGGVADTEYHRMYNKGGMDCASDFASLSGAKVAVTKTWCTARDDKVRAAHDYLEGMTVGVNESFYTFDGDSAKAPGEFERAENNVNCRCILEYTAIETEQ